MDHAAWFKAHRPTLGSGGTLDVPFIAGPEVVTCDNTLFISSREDVDRSGVIFSVPFYGIDGRIRGLVSAIILTRSIQGLIHDSKYALVNPGNGYVVTAEASTIPQQSLQHVAEGKPDPTLIYSEALTFGVKDARSPWMLWAGVPNSSFKSSKDVELADKTRRTNYLLLGLLSAAAVAGLLLSDRLIRQSRALADAARIRESEAQETASHLQGLNYDISRLNMELSDKIRQLGTAQTEIINKGRMAQLGQVVAMVAHEIRNPLGGVRTSTFLLRRKLQPQQFEFDTILDRIDALVHLGAFDKRFARELGDAFGFLCTLRTQAGLAAFEAGQPATNRVRPADLSQIDQEVLVESLRVVLKLRKLITQHYRLDMLGF